MSLSIECRRSKWLALLLGVGEVGPELVPLAADGLGVGCDECAGDPGLALELIDSGLALAGSLTPPMANIARPLRPRLLQVIKIWVNSAASRTLASTRCAINASLWRSMSGASLRNRHPATAQSQRFCVMTSTSEG